MALFQVLRGKAAKLLKKKFHDGYVYFTPDDGAIHIDVETDGEQKRMHVNPTAYQQAVDGGFEGTEEEFKKLTAMLPQFETTEHKDIDGINNPDSTDHYPSNKAMTDYVNSQILAGKEIFVVNWTQSPEVCQADKTYAEIKAALENDVVTVVGKTKNDGTTYATHEITIATDGKIYFRFIWCDETRGTMEKYFWLQEDEYGSSVPPKPVSQQDWAENNEASASYVKNRPGAYDVTDDKTIEVSLVAAPIESPEKNYAGMVYTDICRIYACLVSTNIVGLRDAYNASSISFTDKGNSADIKEPLHLSSDGKYIYSESYDRDYDSSVGDKRVFKILITLEDNLTIYKITYPKAGIYAANTPDQAGTYWHDSISWVGKVITKVKIPNEYIDAPQADWVENDYTAPDYIKNRPGGYTVYHTDTIKANAKDFPTPAIIVTNSYIQQGIYFGIILMREDIDGLSLALENGTVESSDSLTWVSGENYYYTNEVFSTAKNKWFPKCIVILKENTTVEGIKFPKIGIYTTGKDISGHGWVAYNSDFYISWTHNWTEDVKIPEKYLPERTSDNVLAVKFNIDNPENITADHTYEEIKTAYIAGKYVYGYADIEGSSARFHLLDDPIYLMQNRIMFALDITDFEACITAKNTFIEISEAGITPFNEIYFTKLLQLKTNDMTQKVEAGIETNTGDLYIKPINGNKDLGITGAQAGQIAKITAVDASGVPTAWSPVDMPSGDSLGAVLYTPQDLTDEQKRKARENIEALRNNSVYYTYLPDDHSNDIYKLALSGPIGFITGVGAAGMIPPITVIFGAIDRGIVNTFAIDFHGYMYHTGLSLASASEPVWTKIEQLRLNDNGALPQQTMASSPTENMQIATKKYVDDHTEESDPTVPEWAKQPHKPSYTAQEIGALPATTHIPSTADDVNAEPSGAVSQHNVSNVAHSDIRVLIQGLTDRLNALADSDDTTLDQLSEIVAYIKSNKSLIDAITISKVNVADIVDNLTTNSAKKPLSAAQGVAIKALIDAIEVPSDDHINSLIDTKLGVIENGSY